MIGIYCITNLVNGKKYIGQSKNIDRRWEEHKKCKDNKKDNLKLLYQAIRKYGVDNFKFELIEECSPEELNEKEIYWILFYQTFPPKLGKGYNLTPGGDCGRIGKLNSYIEDIIKDLKNNDLIYLKDIAKKYNTSVQTISDINRGETLKKPNIKYPIRNCNIYPRIKTRTKTNYNKCINCGKELKDKNAIRCKSCNNKYLGLKNSTPMPTKLQLISKMFEIKRLQKVGEFFNCSSMLIKKWCKKYNIPTNRKEYTKLYMKEVLGEENIENKKKIIILKIDPKTNSIIEKFNSKAKLLKSIGAKGTNTSTINKYLDTDIIYKGFLWKTTFIDED